VRSTTGTSVQPHEGTVYPARQYAARSSSAKAATRTRARPTRTRARPPTKLMVRIIKDNGREDNGRLRADSSGQHREFRMVDYQGPRPATPKGDLVV